MGSTNRTGATTRLAYGVLRNRWIVRAPVWLYRARLGALFGHRLLMLEHIGRKSGARRYVVLEVVDRPAAHRYVVASGFGTRAQWFRNVRHDPHVRVFVGGSRPMPAVAHVLSPAEAARALDRYADRHPKAWQRLKPVFEATLGAPIDRTGTSLPLVRLDVNPT